jgi:hypothetical protein
MSWASSRRTLILIIIFSVVAAVVAITLIATLYETPSCADGKRNQDEQGIDCGGSCSRVCSFDATKPVVSFVRDVPGLRGRTDVVAYVENPNAASAVKDAKYTVELYSESRTLLASVEGVTDLPPGGGVPLFLPGVYAGGDIVAQAFLEFDEASLDWYRYEDARIVPRVSDVSSSDIGTAPRVRARLSNSSVTLLRNITVIATVFGADGNAFAATKTVVPQVPAQGSTEVILTFALPFPEEPARVDVRPVIPLP